VTIDPFRDPMRAWLGPVLDRLLDVYRGRHRARRSSIAGEPGGAADGAEVLRRSNSDIRAWVDLIGDVVFRIPALRLAEAQASHGAPVYMYRFDWESPTFGGRLGAAHALELPFVWNRLDLPMAPILLGNDLFALQPLATAMHGAWAQFIHTGDPNGGGLPHWPRYDAERRSTLMIDRDCHVADDPGGPARAQWPAVWPG